jgi:beta-glucanase (GH16 family)
MEQNGWNKSNLYNVLHFQNSLTNKKDEIKKISNVSNSNDFNVYSLVWTEENIYWLLNNKITFEQKNTDFMPFDNNHYLLLNLAIGGILGGEVSESFLEEKMLVDYVRIYQ